MASTPSLTDLDNEADRTGLSSPRFMSFTSRRTDYKQLGKEVYAGNMEKSVSKPKSLDSQPWTSQLHTPGATYFLIDFILGQQGATGIHNEMDG